MTLDITVKPKYKRKSDAPKKLTDEMRGIIQADPFMNLCIHDNTRGTGQDKNRLTWEHALYYRGCRVHERVAIVPCLAKYNNDAHGDVKDWNIWVALNRLFALSSRDYVRMIMDRYPKNDWDRKFNALCDKWELIDYKELYERMYETRIKEVIELKNGLRW